MSDLKKRVTGQVTFLYYQDGNLIYRCEDGFQFPVPISDCGTAKFVAQDKALLFMRWIRKYMAAINEAEMPMTIKCSGGEGPENG